MQIKYLLPILLFFISVTYAQDFKTKFEKSKGTETATYEEIIDFYQKLANSYPEISIREMGMTDSGKPLHVVIFEADKKVRSKNTLLINNGIHPGEPDGIDASMMLMRDIVQDDALKKKYKNTVIYTIPVYNIGGSLNRNATSRVNQNGPLTYGFRGNARNFDLNRDFIKNDTKNAKSFAKIFHWINPDVFIDNHVSNGADYQYTLTHLFTQHNKMGGDLGSFLHQNMMPEITKSLHRKNLEITPYVNVFNRVPESGFSQFFDSPRYSTGYTTLFNTLGFMVETHMLKPYQQRVMGTYEILLSTLDFISDNGTEITRLRNSAKNQILRKKQYPIAWEIDSTKTTSLDFKGYQGDFIKSEVTGLNRLKYDRSKPFTKEITYYNYFKPNKSVEIPKAYILPQGWWKVIERLDLNQIVYEKFKKDTSLTVESCKIIRYRTRENAYEGHYPHYNAVVSTTEEQIKFRKGDIYIPTNQNGLRYLLETLELEARDSFFNWNFFDSILQQKEGFSPYVFEDIAARILKNDAVLQKAFEEKKNADSDFAQYWYAQLDYIHKHSEYYEKEHLQYPVYRIKH